MKKYFPPHIFSKFDFNKQLKAVYDLSYTMEKEENTEIFNSRNYTKLSEYVRNLKNQFISDLFESITDLKSLAKFNQYLEQELKIRMKETNFINEFTHNKKDDYTRDRKISNIVVILENLRSTHNVGAIIRSCECFGVAKVILIGTTPNLENDQLTKTAMGTEQYIDIESHKSIDPIIDHYKKNNYTIYALETTEMATDINDMSVKSSSCFIFGNEKFGIEKTTMKKVDQILKINMYGGKNSLNVSNAVAITLHQARRLLEKN